MITDKVFNKISNFSRDPEIKKQNLNITFKIIYSELSFTILVAFGPM